MNPFGDMFNQERLKEAGDALVERQRELQKTTMQIAKTRTEEIIDFWKSVFSVRKPEDLRGLQAKMSQSFDNSIEDSARLAKMMKPIPDKTDKP